VWCGCVCVYGLVVLFVWLGVCCGAFVVSGVGLVLEVRFVAALCCGCVWCGVWCEQVLCVVCCVFVWCLCEWCLLWLLVGYVCCGV
jgi:hypothetical protein